MLYVLDHPTQSAPDRPPQSNSHPVRMARGEARDWNSRGHFFAAAAEAMRRILVDQARRKQADKHGGGRLRVGLPEDLAASEAHSDDLIALDEALSRLESHDPHAARL